MSVNSVDKRYLNPSLPPSEENETTTKKVRFKKLGERITFDENKDKRSNKSESVAIIFKRVDTEPVEAKKIRLQDKKKRSEALREFREFEGRRQEEEEKKLQRASASEENLRAVEASAQKTILEDFIGSVQNMFGSSKQGSTEVSDFDKALESNDIPGIKKSISYYKALKADTVFKMREKCNLNIISAIEKKLQILVDHLVEVQSKIIPEGELEYVYKDNIDSNNSDKLLAAIAYYEGLLERNRAIDEEIKMKEDRAEKVVLSRDLKNGYQIGRYVADLRAKLEGLQKPVNETLNGKEED